MSVAVKYTREHALQIASGWTSSGRVREDLKDSSSTENEKLLSICESSLEYK